MSKHDTRSKIMLALAVLSFGVLAVMLILNHRTPSDKTFGVNNFYAGNEVEEGANPKEIYERLYGGTIADATACRTTMAKALNPVMLGHYVWIVDGDSSIKDESSLSSIVSGSSDPSVLSPYKSGDLIVSPATLTFINANTVQYSEEEISIVAYIGKEYIIRWDDVYCWWCHIGKDEPTKHSHVVGAGGINPKCVEGYVVGQATADTRVSLFKVDENGAQTPCSFVDFYFK